MKTLIIMQRHAKTLDLEIKIAWTV